MARGNGRQDIVCDDVDRNRLREQTARAFNSGTVGLYWNVGKRIRKDVLRELRAEYGQRVVETLAVQLTSEYGRGVGRPSHSALRRDTIPLPLTAL
jgi:hypothetical protein